MAAESPAGPEAEPSDSPQQAAAAAQETSPRSKLRTASAKSESSHRSRHSTDVQKAPTSPNLSQAHAHKANSPEHTSKMKANGRASKRQKVKQNGATEAATADLDADACAGILSDATERPKGAFRKRTRASFQHGLKEVAAKLEAPDKLASDTATQAAEEVKPQPTPASQAVSEATQSASKGQMEARVTTTADSAQAADGPAHPDESAKPAQQEHTAAEQFAKEVRNKAGWGPAVDLNVRSLMASGQLAGQPVHIKLKHREPVHLQGKVQANGMVRSALHVGGPVNHECSLSEFEKLGASKERRPGENVHLTNFGLALKVGLQNEHTSHMLLMHELDKLEMTTAFTSCLSTCGGN